MPELHPDEDLRSIIYRYNKQTIRTKNSVAVSKLFGCENASAHFTKCIGNTLKTISGMDFQNFINKHTYFNLISIFTMRSNQDKMLRYLESGEENHVFHSRLLSFISKEIRYCPKCAIEDYDEIGECYVHRMHQFNKLDICCKHECKLISICSNCNKPLASSVGYYHLNKPSCFHCDKSISTHIEVEGKILKLTIMKEIQVLLQSNVKIDSELLQIKYKAYAFNKGYYHSTKINQHALIKDFDLSYNIEKLNQLGIKFNFNDEHGVNITNFDRNYTNLLLHVLLMRFFAGSVLQFILDEPPSIASSIPFGNGPWNCINQFCYRFKNPSIEKCNRRYERKEKRFIGKFKCKECGMIYRMIYFSNQCFVSDAKILNKGIVWAETILNIAKNKIQNFDDVRIDNNLKMGCKKIIRNPGVNVSRKGLKRSIRDKDWFVNMLSVFEETNSATKTAVRLGTSRTTIEKYLKIYEQKGMVALERLLVSKAYIINRIGVIREEVASLRDKNLSKTSIFKIIGSANHAFLKHNDPVWYEKNFKSIRRKERDIKELDIEIRNSVVEASNKLRENPPYTQIKMTTILKLLPQKFQRKLRLNSSGLPMSITELNASIESKEEYLIRKIPYTISYLKRDGAIITVERILKISPFANSSSRVIEEIKHQLIIKEFIQ